MVGLTYTAADLNYAAGTIAFTLRKEYERAVILNQQIQALTDAQWVDLGIAAADRDTLKQAFADLAFQKTSAFDSSVAVKHLYGLGV